MSKNKLIEQDTKKQNQPNWHELDARLVLEKLKVKSDSGLSKEEVQKRQESGGKNILQPPKKAGLLQKILYQLKDVSIIVLLIAVALSFLLAFRHGDGFIEPFVILGSNFESCIGDNARGKSRESIGSIGKIELPRLHRHTGWGSEND